MSGRPSTSRWVSCPLPTRTIGLRRSLYLVDAEAALDGVVLEAHVLLQIGERNFAGRPVALLGDDDLDDVVFEPALVLARPMQHQHGVGVLFKRPRLSKVSHSRPVVLPVFRSAV